MSEKVTTEENKIKKAESLPEGWKRVRLGEILQYKQPTTYIVKNENYDEKSGIPVLTAGKTFILGYTAEEFGVFGETPVIIFDDFTTESRFIDFPFKVKSSALKILKSKDNQSNLYFIYNLMQIIPFKPGSEHKRFWISEYSKIQVFIPPLPEQQKIVEILETVDNAIEKTDAIIEKYRRIKKGLMADLLTGKIRLIPYGHSEAEGEESPLLISPEAKKFVIGNKTFVAVPNQKPKNSPIGKIPEGWKKVRLGEVIEEVKDRKGRRNVSTVLTVSNVEGLVDQTDFFGRNLSSENTSKYKIVEKWYFVYNPARINVGSIGLNNLYDLAIVSPMYSVFRTKDKLLPKYLYFWTQLPIFRNMVINNTAGSVRESLNFSRLINFDFLLPPLPEQQLIADVLSQVDEVIEKEIQYKEKLERIKKGLMEDLLTGKVRVNNLIKEG